MRARASRGSKEGRKEAMYKREPTKRGRKHPRWAWVCRVSCRQTQPGVARGSETSLGCQSVFCSLPVSSEQKVEGGREIELRQNPLLGG